MFSFNRKGELHDVGSLQILAFAAHRAEAPQNLMKKKTPKRKKRKIKSCHHKDHKDIDKHEMLLYGSVSMFSNQCHLHPNHLKSQDHIYCQSKATYSSCTPFLAFARLSKLMSLAANIFGNAQGTLKHVCLWKNRLQVWTLSTIEWVLAAWMQFSKAWFDLHTVSVFHRFTTYSK